MRLCALLNSFLTDAVEAPKVGRSSCSGDAKTRAGVWFLPEKASSVVMIEEFASSV